VPDLPEHQFLVDSATDNFDNKTLDYKWNTLRSSIEKDYDLETRPGHLRLYLKEEKLTELKAPSFIGRRQEHINFSAMSLMEFTPENECDTAGLVLLQSNEFHFRFLRTKHEKKQYIELIKCSEGVDEVIVSVEYELEKIFLKIEAYGQDYSFYYGNDSKDMKILKRKVDGRILSTDVAGGFVGTYIGMYASSNGKKSENYADYDWFEYQGLLE